MTKIIANILAVLHDLMASKQSKNVWLSSQQETALIAKQPFGTKKYFYYVGIFLIYSFVSFDTAL